MALVTRVMNIAGLVAILALLPVAESILAVEQEEKPPSTTMPGGQPPSIILGERLQRKPPELVGVGEVAKKNALTFLEWASGAPKQQDGLVRELLAGARENLDISRAFCEEAFRTQTEDDTRALIALALLGEMRSPHTEECLMKFVEQPLPDKGTVVEGEILEQNSLAMLQAKAVDGLAYLRSPRADEFVLKTAAQHPSRIVRAEAIAAYLWNNQYSKEAREMLRRLVRQEEQIFIDRVVKETGEPKESFNRKLQDYLNAHPEVRPPTPDKAPDKPQPSIGPPPGF